MGELTVEDIMNRFGLELIAGHEGIHRHINMSDISRPGLEMAGYFDYYPSERVQLIGRKEMSFLETLPSITRRKRLERLCSEDTPAFIIAHGEEGPRELSQLADEKNVPVLRTDYKTTQFSGMLTNYLVGQLAPMTTVHGVLVDVYGVGVLITGGSGVGKSETALELIKKGHRLVADDSVEIRQVSENVLIGTSPKLLKHMLEIRGIGIIDMMTLFGASAVKDDKRVLLAVDLEIWDEDKHYDRLGIDEEKIEILDSQITRLSVPVRPGRNIAVIIEVAAMDYRMKRLGFNAADEFTKRLDQAIAENAEILKAEESD
ncbi:HPr(Ser) kinase/phosphatase [Mammaliicoccus sciuri]|uniref:HPr kinase/phosphorylase n=1 Tax=Sporosarcina newyorkensis TaxID=759851 RepID=A0A1T4YHC1_9BACL|nr:MULTISPECIES: HPr(Ser) kinase/phosphatase [Sporosarcina]MBY0222781.1 HPr kinase/phosphorylase [Sporosarcina aquimarina]SKB01227.1 Hpr(Ser) kinase/phosphatase [Sporosarcina newyorkensis]